MTGSVVVLVVGLPGAGKTTLIDRAVRSADWTVLDTDRFRRRLPQALRSVPVPYVFYVLAIVRAIARHAQLVIQSRGTYAWLRHLITARARACGREAVLVMLEAAPADAVAGQLHRGRVVPRGVMRWQITHWRRLLDAAGSGALFAEGWSHILVLDREQTSQVDDLGELVRGLR